MTLNKQELFERTRMLWPEVIDLPSVSESGSRSDVAQLLHEIYRQNESKFDENDHWMQLAIWAYHQSISKAYVENDFKVYPRDVDFSDFDQMMIQNLKGDECWEHERKIYLDSKE